MKLARGDQLIDTKFRKGKKPYPRIVTLENRINPQGTAVKAYWQVKNNETGNITTIREDRIQTPRWAHVPE